MEEEDRDEGRLVALTKTLRSSADASRRAEDGPSGQDRTHEVLEARALRHVAWALTSDEPDASQAEDEAAPAIV